MADDRSPQANQATWMTELVVRLLAVIAILLPAATGAQHADLAREVATENAALTERIAEITAAIAVASSELERLHDERTGVERKLQRVERRAEVHALGPEFARTVVEQLRRLPRSERFEAAHRARMERLSAVSDANLQTERALEGVDNLEDAVARRLASAQLPEDWAQRRQIENAVQAAMAEQRELLGQLGERQDELIRILRQVDSAEAELDRQYQQARSELTQTLYWIPASPSMRTVSELVPALAWTLSPANWNAAARTLAQQAVLRPMIAIIGVLLAVALLAARGRMRRMLVALSPATLTRRRYRIGHALAALACTAGLALPGPLLLGTASALLRSAHDAELFVVALGEALGVVARLLLALSGFAWLLDENGVAVRHFGRNQAAMSFAARALRRYAALFIPLMFIASLNGLNYAPWANRESLGRLCFVLGMVATAAFFVYLLRRGGPLMVGLVARAPRSLAVGLHGPWLGALVVMPLALGALAALGYFVVAGYFWGRMMVSLFIVLAAVMLYGLMALWVQLQHLRLAQVRREETARVAAAEAPAEAGSEAAEVPPPRLDFAALGEQSRALLDLLVTLLLLGGLFLIWKEALPNLSVVGDYALWSVTETVGGVAVTRQLTVNNLIQAIVAAVVAIVVVRNIGALLDIALLKRFDMQADATYAIKVIARYAIAAAGVLLVSRILGIAWGDAQWLIAALGVGLGFGLQEIVANFVSGLIVLTERPVRVGDVVTVGDITGTVSGIRARSTRVIDFDNKEVIIPNKAFITERVTNWTLANQTTRLLLPIGVAYGNDIARVQKILLEAVRSNPDVLSSPSPSVFFVGFGDSSLDFEIRAFVDSFDKRLRVRHEVYLAAGRALDENGIEIPFPQRDLHIRSAPALAEVLQRPASRNGGA